MNVRIGVMLAAVIVGGCGTVQLYEGPRRERDEVARITGDLRVTAGAPVTVILRQVDGRTLGIGENAVEVLPGSHTLLVDCRIAETGGVSRLVLEAEVFPGERYRLAPEIAPGLRECTNVTLERAQ